LKPPASRGSIPSHMPVPDPAPRPPERSHLALAPLGLLIAVWSSMCGIGGGLFAVPLLHYLRGFPLKEAVATALGLVAATTGAATLTELLHERGALRLDLVAALVLGGWVGAPQGFRLARRIPRRWLALAFGLLLPGVGLRLLLESAPPVEAREALALGPAELLYCVATGTLAGALTPLLGVGGGLVAVPALHLGLGGLGYLGARAASLAMGFVAALRSLVLYRSSGLLHPRPALALALGALLGAVLGGRLVHHEAFTGAARGMMGLTLCALGLRFLWDGLRGPGGERGVQA
jgi:uncharacterized membrane protein YfcA